MRVVSKYVVLNCTIPRTVLLTHCNANILLFFSVPGLNILQDERTRRLNDISELFKLSFSADIKNELLSLASETYVLSLHRHIIRYQGYGGKSYLLGK